MSPALQKHGWLVEMILDHPEAVQFEVRIHHAINAEHAEARARFYVCRRLKVLWNDVICLSVTELV